MCSNLLRKGCKFTPRCGTVTADLDADDAAGLVVGGRRYGIGIPPDQMGKVLEPFGRSRHRSPAAGGLRPRPAARPGADREIHGGSFAIPSTSISARGSASRCSH